MPDPNAAAPGPVNTSGGGFVGGGVNTGGGVFAGRDNISNYYQLDLARLLSVLQANLPANDPAPQALLDTLKQFRYFHQKLYEWKELHNCLNDVVITVDQFAREVERLDATGAPGDARQLGRQWRPVANKVDILLDLAKTVQHIAGEPFALLADGGMRGPAWAVELQVARLRLDEILMPGAAGPLHLYDATTTFVDAAERHMYLADKQLRDAAAELFNLSQLVLGQLAHG